MSRTGISIAKVPCPIGCGFNFYPGNLDRHKRACLRIADAKRRRTLRDQAKAAAATEAHWTTPYRTAAK